MSDRWGPSTVCIECGQAISQSELVECPSCGHVMGKCCVDRSYHPCDRYIAINECREDGSKENLRRMLRSKR